MSIAPTFHRLVNMSPKAIRAWARDPRAACASQRATLARLPKLAALKAKPRAAWTTADEAYARKVVGFIKRHAAQQRTGGCSPLRTVALRNWGHAPACPVPVSCTRPSRKR